jgi:hypothetical protein
MIFRDAVGVPLTLANLLLLALIVAGAAGLLAVHFATEFSTDARLSGPYVQEARQRLEKHSPALREEAAALAEETLPLLATVVLEQARNRYGGPLQTLKSEGYDYLNAMEQQLVEKAQVKVRGSLKRQAEGLSGEFPGPIATDDGGRALDALQTVLDRLVERYYLEEFRHQSQRTISAWRDVEPLEARATDPRWQEQLLNMTIDWALWQFSEFQGSNPLPGDPPDAAVEE